MKSIENRVIAGFLAAGMIASASFPAMAEANNPQFSRTAEEWARLQDNNMEYDELADLIHEYNVTVHANNVALADFKKDYGFTRDDVAKKYRDTAQEIYDDMDYPDPEDPSYAMRMASIAGSEATAKQLEKQADNAVEDSTIMLYGYQQAEATLVSMAQVNMISYYLDDLTLTQAKNKLELAKANDAAVASQVSLGMKTQIEKLSSEEALKQAEQAIETAESSKEQVRQKLCVMLGWKYNDNPVIGSIPEPNLEKINSMNPYADKDKALENNYTLKINKRKLENAQSESTKDTLQKTIKNNEECIGAALVTAYQNVIASRTAYELAKTDTELQNKTMAEAEIKNQIGSISKLEYQTVKSTTEEKNLALESAKLHLVQSMENYDWAVKGLASAS